MDSNTLSALKQLKNSLTPELSAVLTDRVLNEAQKLSSTTAVISSPILLNENQKKELNIIIMKKFPQITNTKFVLNHKLLGGLTLSYGDTTIDLSLANKLNKLTTILSA